MARGTLCASPLSSQQKGKIMDTEEIPEEIAIPLLRALVWCGDQITSVERESAWKWIEDRRGNIEEMGN